MSNFDLREAEYLLAVEKLLLRRVVQLWLLSGGRAA